MMVHPYMSEVQCWSWVVVAFGREATTSERDEAKLRGGFLNSRISPARVYGLQKFTAKIDIELAGVVISLHKRDPDKHIPYILR